MLLGQAGYRGTAVPDDADVLIVNTCGFLAAAEEESLATCASWPRASVRARPSSPRAAWPSAPVSASCARCRASTGCWARGVGWRSCRSSRACGAGEASGSSDATRCSGDPRATELESDTAAARAGRQRISEDQRRLQRAVRFLLDPDVQGQAAQSSPGCRRGRGAGARRRAPQELILIAQDTTDYGRDLGRS